MGQVVGNDNGVTAGLLKKSCDDIQVMKSSRPILVWWSSGPITLLTHPLNTRTHIRVSLQRKWGSWQEKVFHCGQPWPPMTLLCGGLAVPRPKDCGNILPSMLSCQEQHIIKSAQPLVSLDMSNNDAITVVTTHGMSNEQPRLNKILRLHLGTCWIWLVLLE